MLAAGAVALLRERSVDVSALARWMGVTRQALSERLWSSGGTRRRILQLTVLAFADRWAGWVQAALLEDPPVPALPRSAEEVADGLRADLILSVPRASFDDAHRLLSRRLEALRVSAAGNQRL